MASFDALIPVYQNGNATLVIFQNRQLWYLPWSIAAVYNRLAHANLTTKSLIRRQYEQEMGACQNVPLVCQRVGTVYPAFKFRSPLVRTDGASAYVNLAQIAKCKIVSERTCRIILTNDVSLHIQMRQWQVERRIREAKHFSRALKYPDAATT